jgi:hypothetical protein
MTIKRAFFVFFMSFLMASAHGSEINRLSACLADNTSGKDRRDLATWVFFAMSAHPEITPHMKPETEAAVLVSNLRTGQLFNRLMNDVCLDEMRTVTKAIGPQGIEAAFKTLGELAMRELMSNPEVNKRFGDVYQFMNMPALEKALRS